VDVRVNPRFVDEAEILARIVYPLVRFNPDPRGAGCSTGESIKVPQWPFGFKQGQVCLLITCFVELSCTGKRKDTGALRAEHAQITEYRALQLRHDA